MRQLGFIMQEIFKLNQQSSNLTEWEKIPQADKLSIAYKVDQYLFYYEPMYVAQGDTPQFDERFIGYGMTRNTQVFKKPILCCFYFIQNLKVNMENA